MPLTALFEAVLENNQRVIRREINRLTPELVSYIRKKMGLPMDDALEVVHSAFIYFIVRIRGGLIKPGPGLLKYLQVSVDHTAIKMIRDRDRLLSLQDGVREPAVDYSGLDHLIEKERKALLEACIRELPLAQQEFIRFVLEKPEYGPEELAKRFGLSVSNATVRKHRLLKFIREQLRRRYLR